MTISIEDATRFAQTFAGLVDGISVAVLDKAGTVRLALTTMFAGGHLLLEDAPGTGKTALARAMSAVIEGSNSRIQFTPDLLPSDITGVNMYDQKTGDWNFHRGPIFAEIVLADEINRASPKTQSALLEVMEEAQVTVDGVRHRAPAPFMVIATQNPVEQAGTYPLPEAQLDRFLMKTSIGYPSRQAMIDVLAGASAPDRSKLVRPLLSADQVLRLAELAADNHTDRAVLDYIAALAEATRADESSLLGVSTRGAIGMTRCARVWAAAQGRNFVLPDDVKALAGPVWAHRVVVDPDAAFSGATAEGVINRALTTVPAPAVGVR
ncbi:AAA family ATPase [Actinomyces culturomici]|uniref:AAA family ATPase n=1 Tax=Actinomyces culturomici TaxID=1926276 RepID=UPI000E208F57|nr:MoxR family ATPase [Actinomyces culturomici]